MVALEQVEVTPPPLPLSALVPPKAKPPIAAPSGNLPEAPSVATLAPVGPAVPKPAKPVAVTPYDPNAAAVPAPEKPKPDPTTSALAPATTKSPLENRADLERRLAAAQPVYDTFGKAVGDDAHAMADRLSGAEQKIGKVISESGSKVVVTSAQGTTTNQVSLDGSDSTRTLDERGYTVATKRSVSSAEIGADGKVAENSTEHSRTQNFGVGSYSDTDQTKHTESREGTTTVTSRQSSLSVDALKGEASFGRTNAIDIKGPLQTQKASESVTATVGLSGISGTQETTQQVGKDFTTTTTTAGLARSAGQLGLSGGVTEKRGLKGGTEEAETTIHARELSAKGNAGIVSDEKGTGLGGGANMGAKANNEYASMAGSYSAGGKLQSTVKEVPNSNPPKFKITTTISFDLSVGHTGGLEVAKQDALDPSKDAAGQATGKLHKSDAMKASATASATAGFGKSASFSHVMEDSETKAYIEAIKNNGRGSKLPEHQILWSGMKDGWDKAAELWHEISGNHKAILDMPVGTEIERTTKGSAGLKGGVNAGERAPTGVGFGIEGGVGVTGSVTVKLAKLEGGMVKVTASVDGTRDSNWGVSGTAQGITAGHKESHSSGAGEEVVFMLDGNNQKLFEAQLDEIDGCYTAAALLKLAKKPGFVVQETTDRTSESDSDSSSLGAARVSLGVSGQSALSTETKRDAQGNVITSKVNATNEVGGTFGTDDIKIAASEAEGLAGEVTGDKAKVELSQTSKQSDLGKTLDNIAAAASDPLGTLLNPGKVVGSRADVKAIDLNDEEITALATKALDKSKWDSQVGGRRRDAWVEAGNKIRAAITAQDGVVVKTDKTAINLALGGWVKGNDGERVAVLRRMVRPERSNGPPMGKDIAFPDGTQQFKPVWDALMVDDVLAAPKALIATKPKDALDQLQDLNAKLNDLRFDLRDLEAKWAKAEGQHAEMMGHILDRVHACDQAILQAKKAAKDAAKPPRKPMKPASARTEEIMQAFAADEAQAEQDPIDLRAYQENLEQLQVYFDAVFDLLKKARAIGKHANIEEVKQADALFRSARERIAHWKALYDPTYKLWEKLSPRHELKKADMEKLHPHGAQEFYDQVHKEVAIA